MLYGTPAGQPPPLLKSDYVGNTAIHSHEITNFGFMYVTSLSQDLLYLNQAAHKKLRFRFSS